MTHRFGGDPMVTFKVGRHETAFCVHRSLICGASPVFEAAFMGNFEERSGVMKLAEDSSNTFEQLVQWLYTKECEITPAEQCKTPEDRPLQLVQIYILADKYGISPLNDYIMDLLLKEFDLDRRISYLSSRPNVCTLRLTYQNTIPGSCLRKLFAAFFVWHMPGTIWAEIPEYKEVLADTPEFAADLAIEFGLRTSQTFSRSPLEYSRHRFYKNTALSR